MKVVLLTDVPNVGKQWDVLTVADGFARNVLISKGLAAPATSSALAQAKEAQTNTERRAEQDLERVQELASALDDFEVTISARANEHGDLYAAVSPKRIAEALSQHNFRIPQKALRLSEPLKQVGEYPVQVTLDHGLETQIRVIIKPSAESAFAL